MIRSLALSCLTTYSILIFSCDRVDPEAPIGSQGDVLEEEGSVLVGDPDLKTIGEFDAIDVEIPGEEEVGETPAADVPSGEIQDPELVAQTFSIYRIDISEMKSSCPGNTVNMERIKVKMGGEFLVDTFAGYPNDPDPKYNSGKIGVYDVDITTSGDYTDFFPYEAFGGGFGAGWWSAQNTFANETPSPAIVPVWYQLNFKGQKVKIDSMFINGGSVSLGANFEPCSPRDFSISGSNDGMNWEVLADVSDQDTQNGMEVFLKYPLIPQS